ncbi:TatD family hydrolase [Bergeyella zoohelcum]|uniref:TatD family hydrolase n=1 Tax=Bergeyella zoohelcum TaxID=1015 RepID=A0A7Z8YRE7_9FLAO|nr:TatD family hydrolase [Bergeyella zoohelcum]VDH04555.1 TatD family hydrolase [Bergeyella zoohelcum]
MIDTHTHLYSEQFDEDRKEMIKRALDAGVERFYLPAIDASHHEKMFALEAEYPEYMHAMMGLHPCDVRAEDYHHELAIVKKYLDERTFCAIGEIGIDLYWDKSTFGIQKEAFEQQIDWAIEKDIPIVIHSRESTEETLAILNAKKHPRLRGIFHCFSGNKEQAERVVELNFLLGIGGVVTFKNGKIDQFIAQIPLEHIVLETDAPYLAPVPHRGKRNESAFIKLVAEKLATLYQKPLEEIIAQTSANAKRVFG